MTLRLFSTNLVINTAATMEETDLESSSFPARSIARLISLALAFRNDLFEDQLSTGVSLVDN